MRVLAVLMFAAMLSACSFLDQLVLDGYRLDPNKIYLGPATVQLTTRELEHYACVRAPLLCEQRGSQWDCRCPY